MNKTFPILRIFPPCVGCRLVDCGSERIRERVNVCPRANRRDPSSLLLHELANSVGEGGRRPNGCRTYHSSTIATPQRSLALSATFSNPTVRKRRDAAVNTRTFRRKMYSYSQRQQNATASWSNLLPSPN